MKPPVPYFGGKMTIGPAIAALLPDHSHYVEPFAGSFAVDQALMTFWRVLRERRASANENRQTRVSPSQAAGAHGRSLAAEVCSLLPTPTATPYGNNQSSSVGAAVRPSLEGIARTQLLPTPTAMDSHSARNATANRSVPYDPRNHSGWTLSDVAYADRWGEYGPAIARWEKVLRRPVPEPTEATGRGGKARLSPRFVEWMMGLPKGHVTDPAIWRAHPEVIGRRAARIRPSAARNAQLRILGNGVLPLQAVHAYDLLFHILREVV